MERHRKFQSPSALGSGVRAKIFKVPRRVVVELHRKFQSPSARGSGGRKKFFKVPLRVVVERHRKFQSPEALGSGGKATSALFSLWLVQGCPTTTSLQYLPLRPIHLATYFLYIPDASLSRVYSVNSHRTPKYLCRRPALAVCATRPDSYTKLYDGTVYY